MKKLGLYTSMETLYEEKGHQEEMLPENKLIFKLFAYYLLFITVRFFAKSFKFLKGSSNTYLQIWQFFVFFVNVDSTLLRRRK